MTSHRITLAEWTQAHPRAPRLLSWRVSALTLLASVIAGNAIVIIEAVK